MKTQPYTHFWQRIHDSAKNKGILLRVMFELTYRCNFKCKHCYVPQSCREYGELTTKEIFSILDQLAAIGCFYLGFTGGEPFIRKDILDILWYARKKGFEVIIYTNASFIDTRIADELAKLRLNKVDITIPGMGREVFEHVSGVSGSRDRVFNAIDLLHKRGVNMGFKTCLLEENGHDIKDIEDFAASLGALHRLDTMLSARLDGDREPYSFRRQESSSRELNIENGACIYVERAAADNLFKCGVGASQAAITPLGELKMCLMIDYPKYIVAGDRLKDAWMKLKKAVSSIRPDENYKCNICELEPYCKWCPAKAWLYNKTFTSCEPESRLWAEKIGKEAKLIKNA